MMMTYNAMYVLHAVPNCPLIVKLRALGLEDCIINRIKNHLYSRKDIAKWLLWMELNLILFQSSLMSHRDPLDYYSS